ncbi:hypothetical protein QYE76_033266 [Lolium multiflorum]|uniref:Uncharacterized protein n=1 Tax=Lolium multiflorum TaxID=4521 RepID=A0AAD8QV48_LOLMU|nr:hypothetical protein QYE76_033266 [Lolium multiflorum]
MAPKHEFEPSANDHEAGSSQPVAPAPFAMGPPATPRRDRIYVTVAVAQMFWEADVPMLWGDVQLPHGWHLRPDRVPVPLIPVSGRARVAEIRRRRAQLPADLREDPPTATQEAGRRPDGLYMDEPAAAPAQAPQSQPEEDDDPELQAALAASRELNDLEELAK